MRRGKSSPTAWRALATPLRAVWLAVGLVVALLGPAPTMAMPVMTMAATDCAGAAHADGDHHDKRDAADHAGGCCVFHCAPATASPLIAATVRARAIFRIPPALEAASEGVVLPILVPPPRA